MKINNEISNNFELLAGSKHEQASFSMLSGLFSINFGEVFSENNTEENLDEFIFNEDEIKFVDYISNLVPSLKNDNKKNISFEKIETQISLDNSLSLEVKEKILQFLNKAKSYLNSFQIKMPEDKINKFKTNIDVGKIIKKNTVTLDVIVHEKKHNDSKPNNKNVSILDLSKSKDNKLEINKSNTASVTPLSGQVYFDGITINGGKLVVNSGVTVKTDNNYGYVINSGGEIEVQGGLLWNTANYANSFYINGGVLDVNGGEVRIGDLAYDTDAELDMVNGTIDLSGGTINICAELDVANGTINISGGFLNIGAYTGTSTNYGTAGEHTFDMDAGNLNLTGGIVTILRQYNNSTTEIIDIPSSVVVNATSSNTIVLGRGAGTTENFYIDLCLQNNERLGSILIDAGNYNGILKRNLFLNGDLTILTGQFEGDDEEDITLKGSIFTSSTNPLTGYWEDLNFDGVNATFGSFSDDDIDININSGNVTANGNISVDRIVVYSGATFNVGSSSFVADNLVNIDGTLIFSNALIVWGIFGCFWWAQGRGCRAAAALSFRIITQRY
mgnify:CR=1 FL=1